MEFYRKIIKLLCYVFITGVIYLQVGGAAISSQTENLENLNCVKFNQVYRKACHNCYENQHSSSLGQALNATRVVELDVHSHETGSIFGDPDQAPKGVWFVRHFSNPFGAENNNNCGDGNNNFAVCLNDIGYWHYNNPDHDPIVVFLDLKGMGVNVAGDFWRGNHKPTDLDNVLNQFAINYGGQDIIYRPNDLKGDFPTTRLAATNQNWPTFGELKGKILFVLTGQSRYMNRYIDDLRDANRDPVAFISLTPDAFATAINGYRPQYTQADTFNETVFYNLSGDYLNVANYTAENGFISRNWQGNASPSDYGERIYRKVNNIAVYNIFDPFYQDTNGDGVSDIILNDKLLNAEIDNKVLGSSSTMYVGSQYDQVLEYATQSITTHNLQVFPNTHYNISAGQEVNLLPGTEIRQGTDTEIFIADCETAITTRRPVFQNIPEEKNKLFTASLENQIEIEKSEIIKSPKVYPNPTSDILNISLEGIIKENVLFTMYDLNGRVVKIKTHKPQQGIQHNFMIDLNSLETGVYFYNIQVESTSYTGKVIKTDF